MCLKVGEFTGVKPLQTLLGKLRLDWPRRTPSTRLDILDILVTASLDYGVEMLWDFNVARHPLHPERRAVYLNVGATFPLWSSHMRALKANRKTETFLRRCAEVVGRRGQSYSGMISDVVWTHRMLTTVLGSPNLLNQPHYDPLSDFELRVALNHHLPENSQLWPEDEVVNFQSSYFSRFDTLFLNDSSTRSRLKLYIGAYVVWYMAPFTSFYLSRSLMEDMRHPERSHIYVRSRCFYAVKALMPVVIWKIQDQLAGSLNIVEQQRIFAQIYDHFIRFIGFTDPDRVHKAKELLDSVSVVAFNRSISWEFLNKLYSYVPLPKGDFMAGFLGTTSATAVFFKESLRDPQDDIVHVPSAVEVNSYRLIVTREITVPQPLRRSPLFTLGQWEEVKIASIGAHFGFYIFYAFYYGFILNSRFEDSYQDPWRMTLIFLEMWESFRLNPYVNYVEEAMTVHVFLQMLGTDLAGGAYRGIVGSNRTDLIDTDHTALKNVTSEQMFFLAACFVHCDAIDSALCNAGVALSCGFAQAFSCPANRSAFEHNQCIMDLNNTSSAEEKGRPPHEDMQRLVN